MATIGTLTAFIGLDTKKFSKGIRRVTKQTKAFASDLGKITMQVGKFGAGLGIAAAGGLALWTRSGMKNIDVLKDWADRLGVSTRALGALQFAGTQTGVSIETMNMALQRMVRRIAEAAQGTGEAQGALKELGLGAATLALLPVDQQFHRIADKMIEVTNQGNRVRLAMKLFDSEGVALVNTLGVGSKGLRAFGADAESLGILVDDLGANKVTAANRSLDRMEELSSGLGKILAVELSPFIEVAANRLTEFATAGDGFRAKVLPAIESVLVGVAELADFINGAKAAWHGLAAVAMGALQAMTRPVQLFYKNVERLLKLIGVELPTELRLLAEMSDAFGQAGAESARKAEEAFALYKSGKNARSALEFFRKLREEADKVRLPGVDGPKGPGSGLIDVNAMQNSLQAVENTLKKLRDRAKSIFEATRTPLEQMHTRAKELRDLLTKKLIDKDTFSRALAKAGVELGIVGQTKEVEFAQPGSFEQIIRGNVSLGGPSKKKGAAEQELPKQTVLLAQINDILRSGIPAVAV